MVKEIVKDTKILSKISREFDKDKDSEVLVNLKETANKWSESCVGLAAIQIGEPVRCFVVKNPKTGKWQTYINPEITSYSEDTYEIEEGCMSLEGKRKVTRHTWINITYTDLVGGTVHERATGYKAEIIQHEYDHLDGKLI